MRCQYVCNMYCVFRNLGSGGGYCGNYSNTLLSKLLSGFLGAISCDTADLIFFRELRISHNSLNNGPTLIARSAENCNQLRHVLRFKVLIKIIGDTGKVEWDGCCL